MGETLEIGYIVENPFIDRTELRIRPGITVFTGLNSTFKSIAARTMLVCKNDVEELYKPTFLQFESTKVEFLVSHDDIVCGAEKGLIPDSRIVLRAFLLAHESVKLMRGLMDDLVNMARVYGDERLRTIAISMEQNIKRLLYLLGMESFIQDLLNVKACTSLEVASQLWRKLDEVLDEVVKELQEFKSREQVRKAVVPLTVLSLDREDVILRTTILDIRFGAQIKQEMVSTSVIAPLMFEYVTAFLAMPKNKVLVIEEPEESMTPLQQVVFTRYLEKIVVESMRILPYKSYVIVTTHSPYVAYTFSNEVPVKFFNYNADANRITIEDKPMKSFVLADILLTAYEGS